MTAEEVLVSKQRLLEDVPGKWVAHNNGGCLRLGMTDRRVNQTGNI